MRGKLNIGAHLAKKLISFMKATNLLLTLTARFVDKEGNKQKEDCPTMDHSCYNLCKILFQLIFSETNAAILYQFSTCRDNCYNQGKSF